MRVHPYGSASTGYQLALVGSSPAQIRLLPNVPDWAASWTGIVEDSSNAGVAFGIGEITRPGAADAARATLSSRVHGLERAGRIARSATFVVQLADVAVDTVNVFQASNPKQYAAAVNEWVRSRFTFFAGLAGAKGGAVVGAIIPRAGFVGAPLGALFGGLGSGYAAGRAYDQWLDDAVMDFARSHYDSRR